MYSQALQEKPRSVSVFVKPDPIIEAKGAYFFFASDTFRDIYSSGGFQVQISGAYPVYYGLQIYGAVGYNEAWGKSQNGNDPTAMWQIPVDLGVRPVFTIASFVQYYFTVGPRYFHVQQYNNSPYVNPTIGRNGIGLFANTGFNFYVLNRMLIDLFAEYAYEPTHFSSSRTNVYGGSVQVSTYAFGLGLGYKF